EAHGLTICQSGGGRHNATGEHSSPFPRHARMNPHDDCKRIDLHCHSAASNRAAEVLLNAIHCPECYSDPADVYAQAKRRGMDFVTITDHDTIEGVERVREGVEGGRDDVLVGEELTCWFPEDRCKLHLLVYGID